MNAEILSGRWSEFTGEAKRMWGKLTDDDLAVSKGNLEAIKGRLTSAYGYSKERASEEVDSLTERFSSKLADTTEHAKDMVREKTEPKRDHSTLIAALLALSAVAVHHAPVYAAGKSSTAGAKVETASEKMRTTLYKWTDKDSLVVKFDKGSARIPEDEKKRIRALMESNRQKGHELRITLAAWADKDFIKEDETAKSASNSDKALADKRLKAIRDFLKAEKISYSTEQEYNMAKEPSRFAKLIETRDAMVKEGVVQDKTTNSAALNRDIELLKDDGGAQKAVIALPEQ